MRIYENIPDVADGFWDAYHLVTPGFGLRAVFLVSLIPGLLLVLFIRPEYWPFWISVGPVFGLLQHLFVQLDINGT